MMIKDFYLNIHHRKILDRMYESEDKINNALEKLAYLEKWTMPGSYEHYIITEVRNCLYGAK